MSTDEPRPQGCTNFKLQQLSRLIARRYDEHLAGAGLRGTQYSLLSQIVVHGPLRAGELARRMHLDNSTLTRTLDTLERAGWIERTVGDDGRSRMVAATTAGRQRRAEAQRCWKQAQLEINARLGDAEIVRLHNLLDELTQTLDQADVASTR